MTTAFIVINALITIAALILCIRAWKGLRDVSKPKPEEPKLEHDTTMSGEYLRGWGWMYRAECSACDWWQDSYSPQTAVDKGVDHEGRHV